MTSPFSGFENASLTFQVAAAGTVTDAYGNPVPNSSAVVISAKLSRDGNATAQSYPGLDENEIALKGHLVDPLLLPAGIVAGMEASCELTEAPNRTRSGRFRLLDAQQSPYTQAIAETSGIFRIRGLFRSR